MSTAPKVSVIIPCYNREKFIRKTIDSVLEQTYTNVEIVAVDDGCTDTTREKLDSYRQIIKVLEHPGRINKGQSAGINLGIRSTKSKYISILDSDDMFKPNKIEMQVKFLEENPEYEVVYSNAEIIDETDKVLYIALPSNHKERGLPHEILLKCTMGCPSAYLVKRSAYNKAGFFDESLRSAQDHDMVIRLAEVSKIGYLNEVLWCKREHGDSISQLHAERRWTAGFVILEKACKRYPYTFSVKNKRRAVLHFRMGQHFYKQKNYIRSLPRFVFAALHDPARAFKVMINKEAI